MLRRCSKIRIKLQIRYSCNWFPCLAQPMLYKYCPNLFEFNTVFIWFAHLSSYKSKVRIIVWTVSAIIARSFRHKNYQRSSWVDSTQILDKLTASICANLQYCLFITPEDIKRVVCHQDLNSNRIKCEYYCLLMNHRHSPSFLMAIKLESLLRMNANFETLKRSAKQVLFVFRLPLFSTFKCIKYFSAFDIKYRLSRRAKLC